MSRRLRISSLFTLAIPIYYHYLVQRVSVMCWSVWSVQLDGADEIKKAQDQLNKQLFEMDSNLQRIAAPNMKALEK